jgi:uncharacterized OB-fold protein
MAQQGSHVMKGVPPADVISLSPSPSTEPFWAAAAEHRLVIPRCTNCGMFRLPPSPFCWNCRTQAVEWIEHDGAGTIYSFTVIRHAVIPAVRDALPFVAAVVELPNTNGCRLVGNVVDCEPAAVSVGLRVALGWYDVREGTSVPVFRLADHR